MSGVSCLHFHVCVWNTYCDSQKCVWDLFFCCLQNKNSDYCAPLTSFDWNETDPKRLGTSSIDTTCTIWDIERGVVDTQLIAHDKEVYDIAWGGKGVFASVSADGSVRVFDLRCCSRIFFDFSVVSIFPPVIIRQMWTYFAKIEIRQLQASHACRDCILPSEAVLMYCAHILRHHDEINASSILCEEQMCITSFQWHDLFVDMILCWDIDIMLLPWVP